MGFDALHDGTGERTISAATTFHPCRRHLIPKGTNAVSTTATAAARRERVATHTPPHRMPTTVAEGGHIAIGPFPPSQPRLTSAAHRSGALFIWRGITAAPFSAPTAHRPDHAREPRSPLLLPVPSLPSLPRRRSLPFPPAADLLPAASPSSTHRRLVLGGRPGASSNRCRQRRPPPGGSPSADCKRG